MQRTCQQRQQPRLVICQQQQRLSSLASPACAAHAVLVLRHICQADLQRLKKRRDRGSGENG
jgi:hypothetical protein